MGKSAVIEANKQFFESITRMQHTLVDSYLKNGDIFCHGSVDYVRLDGTTHHAYFSTLLKFKQNKIQQYLVFADISQL